MARVTTEDCVDKVPNRFDLVMLAAHRARELSAGLELTVARDNDKNSVVALREIAEETLSPEQLTEAAIAARQAHVEVDEPEDDEMDLLMNETGQPRESQDLPEVSDMAEEDLLRALMEAQRER